MPLHLFRDDSIEEFQTMIKGIFTGDDRIATKAYLKLFIEDIVINLPRIDIFCKSDVLLAAMGNKTAVRNGDFLTADLFWLQRTYNCKKIWTSVRVPLKTQISGLS